MEFEDLRIKVLGPKVSVNSKKYFTSNSISSSPTGRLEKVFRITGYIYSIVTFVSVTFSGSVFCERLLEG